MERDPASVHVVVVGSSIMDIPIRVASLPTRGESLIGRGLGFFLGGKGANQAVALARLGVHVSLISCVGEDLFGDEFLKQFELEGIDATGVVRRDNQPTGLGIPLILDDGGNCIIVAPSSALDLQVQDVDRLEDRIRSASVLLLQLEGSEISIRRAMEIAQASGIPIWLNVAPFTDIARAVANDATVLIANEVEAGLLLGTNIATVADACKAAELLRARGLEAAVITLGERGTVFASKSETTHVEAFRVDAIDSTGAGDAFCAGLLHAQLHGKDLHSSILFGNACGAAACLRLGAMDSLPRALDVDELFSET